MVKLEQVQVGTKIRAISPDAEIPPKFAGRPPVNPKSQQQQRTAGGWQGAQGLAEDVRYYGGWMRDEAFKRIGHLYPKVKITAEMAKGRPDLKNYISKELTVIAWLWARTVRSPNPAVCEARTVLGEVSFEAIADEVEDAVDDPANPVHPRVVELCGERKPVGRQSGRPVRRRRQR